jgi:hypothetical protein
MSSYVVRCLAASVNIPLNRGSDDWILPSGTSTFGIDGAVARGREQWTNKFPQEPPSLKGDNTYYAY